MILERCSTHKDVLNLFLTCGSMYSEAASIFYREVVLDTTQSRGTTDPFLSGQSNRFSSRRHVRNMTIKFYMKDHMHLFHEKYAPALKDMVEQGKLQSLQLEIRSRFPSAEFWGGDQDVSLPETLRLIAGRNKDTEIIAPRFVAKRPFQSFLKFLKESNVPQIRLYIPSNDHHEFWCAFHRTHATGKECNGEWKGTASILRVKWKAVLKSLRGAQVVKT